MAPDISNIDVGRKGCGAGKTGTTMAVVGVVDDTSVIQSGAVGLSGSFEGTKEGGSYSPPPSPGGSPTPYTRIRLLRPEDAFPPLEEFDVSPTSGFLPEEPPLGRLPLEFEEWERVVDELPALLLADKLRQRVRGVPVLDVRGLDTLPLLRRAAVVLSFLVHAYVWGRHQSRQGVARVLPPQLAVPFCTVCNKLGLRPVTCHAMVDLWNWRLLDPSRVHDRTVSNLATMHTFTGGTDESYFYLLTTELESVGAPALPRMRTVINLAKEGLLRGGQDDAVTTDMERHFEAMRVVLLQMTSLMQRMNLYLDPHVFYNQVRPYLAGWSLVTGGVVYQSVSPSSLPSSWPFGSSPEGPVLQLAGGSAAQSSLIQAFDIFLNVVHHPTGEGPSAHRSRAGTTNTTGSGSGTTTTTTTTTSNSSSSSSITSSSPTPTAATAAAGASAGRHNFILDMRNYMPAPHRAFLQALDRHARSVSVYVNLVSHPSLTRSFNALIAQLGSFRDMHIQVVTRYIMIQSKRSPSTSTTSSPMPKGHPTSSSTSKPLPLPSSSTHLSKLHLSDTPETVKGTGGTNLIPFLQQSRDETKASAIRRP